MIMKRSSNSGILTVMQVDSPRLTSTKILILQIMKLSESHVIVEYENI